MQVYYACQFDDGVGVVPQNWIWKEKGEIWCRWVSTKRHVEAGEPANPNWKTYKIVKFLSKRTSKSFVVIARFLFF